MSTLPGFFEQPETIDRRWNAFGGDKYVIHSLTECHCFVMIPGWTEELGR